MAIEAAFPIGGKKALLELLLTHTLKVALYGSAASLGLATEGYTTDGEVSGAGYTAGGKEVAGLTVAVGGNVAYLDFDDVVWPSSTISAEGALLYVDSIEGKPALGVYPFGGTVSSNNSPFTFVVPPPSAARAVVRLS